jgi:hypothetical protein
MRAQRARERAFLKTGLIANGALTCSLRSRVYGVRVCVKKFALAPRSPALTFSTFSTRL